MQQHEFRIVRARGDDEQFRHRVEVARQWLHDEPKVLEFWDEETTWGKRPAVVFTLETTDDFDRAQINALLQKTYRFD